MKNHSDQDDPAVVPDPTQDTLLLTPIGINNRLGNLRAAFFAVITGQGAREGYLAAVDQGIISLSNFVATILLARASTPTELGVYGVGFTSLRLIRALQEGLTIQPLNAFGAGMKEADFKPYATSTSLIQVLLALFSALAAALGGWLLISTGNDVAGPTLFALWSPFFFWQLQEYIRRVLYTRGSIASAVFNTVLANGFRLGLMIWWMSSARLNGVLSLQAIAWGSLLALLPGLWQTRNFWTQDFINLKETWKRNWAFGRWLIGSTIANWIAVEFYPVLTAGMLSFAAAGAYRAIQNLVAPIHLLMRALDTFLTPRAARFYQRDHWGILDRLTRLTYMILGVPIFAILAIAVIFREQLLELLYGSTYLAYSNGIILMALFYALWFAYWPLQIILKAARISTPIFIANLCAILAMFTLGIWMINRWGVYGTMAGQALNALVAFIVLAWFWRAIHRKSV
jgi:O-antigen/teichoic acid export membrane protein